MGDTLGVIGAGGHAAVVVATALGAGFDVVAIVDDDPARAESDVLGLPVTVPVDAITDFDVAGAVIAIGDNAVRLSLGRRLRIRYARIIAAEATVHDSVDIGDGSVVFAGAVIQPRTAIGDHVIVNTSATIDHDCRIGHGVHIAPGTTICGGVTIGDSVTVGAGATIVPNVSVGDGAVIGAGSVVIADVGPATTVVGSPARPVERA